MDVGGVGELTGAIPVAFPLQSIMVLSLFRGLSSMLFPRKLVKKVMCI
jgi:hypothetical protein